MSTRTPPAPGLILPTLVAYGRLLNGHDLLAWLGVPRRPVPWHLILGVSAAVILATIAVRIHRRWRREQGLDLDRVPRRWRPEWGIGAVVLFLLNPLMVWLGGGGLLVQSIAIAVAILTCTALAVVVAVKEPRRWQEDAERHHAKQADAFL